MKRPATPKVLLALLAVALAAALAAPRLVAGRDLLLAWWSVAGFAAACAAIQAASWTRFTRRLEAEPVPLAAGEPAAIDFDRPWKGGGT